MSTNKTSNLSLHRWVKTDPFKMEEMNENFAALDLNAGLTWEKLETLEAADAALAAGAVRVASGSYTGTGGTSGSLSFDFAPKLVIVSRSGDGYRGGFPWIAGANWGYAQNDSAYTSVVTLSWSGNRLNWSSRTNEPEQALNANGVEYRWLALG